MKRMIFLGLTNAWVSSMAFAVPPVTLSGPIPTIPPTYDAGITQTLIYSITNNVPNHSFPLTIGGIFGSIARTNVANDCGNHLPPAKDSNHPSTCNIGIAITPTSADVGYTINQTLLVNYQARTPLSTTISFTVTEPSNQYPFRFLTNDLTVIDGRPVFSADGKSIIFMRQPNDGSKNPRSVLYTIPLDGTDKATMLFDNINPNTGQPFNASRPDYLHCYNPICHQQYEVAFDGAEAGIWLLDVKTKKVIQVLETIIGSNSYTWSYPAWYPDGKNLSVSNYNSYPQTLYHELVEVNTNIFNSFTLITSHQNVWAGQSTVSQSNPNMIAFAGQVSPNPPGTCTCSQGCDSDGYAEDCNQIWIKDHSFLAPIDSGQGRAPWFSPNGKYIVFESNRANPDDHTIHRLFVYSLEKKTIEVITSPSLNVQHGKWSPDGTKIVFATQLLGGAQGIALIDVGNKFK